jgi:hypothetical protein
VHARRRRARVLGEAIERQDSSCTYRRRSQ